MVTELRKTLEAKGVDTDDLEADFDSQLSPEEAEEVRSALMEEQLQGFKKQVHPWEIQFYHRGTEPQNEFFLEEETLEQQKGELTSSGFDTGKVFSSWKIGPGTGEILYENVGKEFLEFASQEISDRRRGKLQFIDEVAFDPENIDFSEAVRWFEDRDSLDFDSFNSELFYNDPGFRLGGDEKIYEQTIDKFWHDLSSRDITEYEKVKRGLLLDLTTTIEGLAQKREDPEDFNETVQEYQDFFHRFRPEKYQERLEDDTEYTVHTVLGRNKLTEAAYTLGTCHVDYGGDRENPVTDNLLKEIQMMHHRDPYTFVHAIGKDDELAGYVRSFLMEDSGGDEFLAIDTVEARNVHGIEMKNIEKSMEDKDDVIAAGTLAAIAHGERLGADYVAGRDARVKFGPRQGYGNTSKDIEYSKIGDAVPYYGVARLVEGDTVERYIPETGRVEEWETPPILEPSFKTYHSPGDLEVRGFRTEPGTHEGEAKILYEAP